MRFFSPASGMERLSPHQYLLLCKAHAKKYWKHYALPPLAVIFLQFFFRIDVNYTSSLPDHVFVTIKGWKTGLKRGDYVAYHFPTETSISPFRKGDHMVKIVAGVAGDEVRMDLDRNFQIVTSGTPDAFTKVLGGSSVGTAKSISITGKPLKPGPVGVIPEGSYYMYAPHKDSLDSRYAMVGWITEKDIIGRTFALY